MAIRVQNVGKNSPAAALGLGAGAVLLSVDGVELTDALDYRYYTAAARFSLAASCDGQLHYYDVQKEEGQPFGCALAESSAETDCGHDCIFCLAKQLPTGLRAELYNRTRGKISFAQGQFVLPDMLTERNLERIVRMKIAPVCLCLHATEDALWHKLTGGQPVLPIVRRLAEAGVPLCLRMILCRGWNDGAALEQTLHDIETLGDAVQSVEVLPATVVPGSQLTPYDQPGAVAVLEVLEAWDSRWRGSRSRRVLYPAEEWYRLAGRRLPPPECYDADSPQTAGVQARFLQNFVQGLNQLPRLPLVLPRHVDVLTASDTHLLLEEMAEEVHQRFRTISVRVHEAPGALAGDSRLLQGTDVLRAWQTPPRGRAILLPAWVLGEGETLADGMTPAQLGKTLHTPVRVLPAVGSLAARTLTGWR